jgi:glyoxylase-like metal-dependent hydrolase (beta-lactamase superfamily II)
VGDSPPGHPEIQRFVAPNPGPMTLEGTNTYVVATGAGAFVIDPGPADDAHAAVVRAAADARGGIEGILLTHSHADHSAAVPLLGEAPLLWGDVGQAEESSGETGAPRPDDGRPQPPDRVGPFEVIPTPGHATDHVCFALGGALFSGDLVLGRGSSFVPPDGGSLAAYLESLRTILDRDPELLCPGHGPYVTTPRAKLAEYIDHRLDRERRLLAALADGERSRERLLELVWDDVEPGLRPAAAVVMEAHLEKLDAEGRLPDDLDRAGH